MPTAPNITYTITQIKPSLKGDVEVPIPLSGSARCSFASGYNKIYFIFRSDISLCRYEIRVTEATADYGVGLGNLAYYLTGSIAANVNHACTITVNSTNFSAGDTTYRVSMYAQNAVDRTWDATEFLLDVNGSQLTTSDSSPLEVYVVDDTDKYYISGGTATAVLIRECSGGDAAKLRLELVNAGYTTAELENAKYLQVLGGNPGTVTLNVSTFGAIGSGIKLVHKKTDGTWEVLFNGVIPSNLQIPITLAEFGPVVRLITS